MIISMPVPGVFAFFSNALNLQRITPPELCFQIVTPTPIEMGQETRIDYRLRLYGIPFNWSTLITIWDPPRRFVDVQIRGPYKQWVHTHDFIGRSDGTEIVDNVVYRLPLWPFGEAFHPLIRRQLLRIFLFREKTIREIFEDRDLLLNLK
jgi:ligand-binding SRPBCC domain-containing protein